MATLHQTITTSFKHPSGTPYTLDADYDFATKTATIVDPFNPAIKAVFKEVSATRFNTFKAFADALEDCLGWNVLGSGYKTITLDDNTDPKQPLVLQGTVSSK